jgi:DNA processing protein
LANNGLINWLRLARTDGVGPVTFFGLLTKYSTPENALKAVAKFSTQSGNLKYSIPPLEQIIQEIELTEKYGGKFLTADDKLFPIGLGALTPPPPIISVIGNLSLLQKPMIAMVGARNASMAGMKMAQNLARNLGNAGYVIVSGLARGIDGAAHIASIETGTIAVVAGGIDHIYPPEHDGLYHKIAEYGAIISENPFGAKVFARDFPRRNRIISGLSLGTIVVEAEEKSGSLITARFANEQGREVMAVPGSPLDPRAAGPNNLIKEGASLVTSHHDVLGNVSSNFKISSSDSYEYKSNTDFNPDDALKKQIEELLSPAAISLDEICRYTGYSWRIIAAIIIELELEGKAFLKSGNMVANTP